MDEKIFMTRLDVRQLKSVRLWSDEVDNECVVINGRKRGILFMIRFVLSVFLENKIYLQLFIIILFIIGGKKFCILFYQGIYLIKINFDRYIYIDQYFCI